MSKKFVKFVAIGDGGCGKTCLLHTYGKGNFPTSNIPTIIDNFSKNIIHEPSGATFNVQLWDTAGQEEYDKVRVLSYPGTDMFLVCFSVVRPDSLENVKDKWLPEIEPFMKKEKACVILVGLKTDLRNDSSILKEGTAIITKAHGQELAATLGFAGYGECSAQKDDGVTELFDQCAKIIVEASGKKKKDCIIC